MLVMMTWWWSGRVVAQLPKGGRQRKIPLQERGGRIVSSLLFMLSTQRKATSSKSVWPSRRRVALALDR